MRYIFNFVGTLPFAGKFLIGKEVFEVYESTSMMQRHKEYIEALLLLIIMVLAHGAQAKMGFNALQHSAPLFAKAYFVAYTATMTLVAMTQVYLLYRITRYHLTRPVAREEHSMYEPKALQLLFAFVFTLTAQTIFMVLSRTYS